MAYEFRFPDVGEGITEGELLAWKVQEGDMVAEDQVLAEVETDKAVVELPSPRAGRIVKLHAEEGAIINVGDVLVTIEEMAPAEAAVAAAPAPSAAVPEAAEPPPGEHQEVEEEEEEVPFTSVVGRLEEAPEEEEVAAPAAAPPGAAAPPVEPAPPSPVAPSPGRGPSVAAPGPREGGVGREILALPSERALAKELGIDLEQVHGTGPGGRILRQDVEDFAEAQTYGRPLAAPSIQPEEAPAAEPHLGGVLEQDEYGVIERVALRGVKRSMALKMKESVSRQAQVTATEQADITLIRRIREKERNLAAERGIRLTYLAFVLKATAHALKRFPRLNSVMTEGEEEIVLKRYYNIGIAIDTKAGLLVPNVKDVDRKSIFRLAEEIMDLHDRAQERKIELSDLKGGTFTVTNYGSISGIYATPIPNYPEVAILGMGRVTESPVVKNGEMVVRHILPLALTFDHRVIDGGEAGRFTNLVISYLEDPDLLLLEGA